MYNLLNRLFFDFSLDENGNILDSETVQLERAQFAAKRKQRHGALMPNKSYFIEFFGATDDELELEIPVNPTAHQRQVRASVMVTFLREHYHKCLLTTLRDKCMRKLARQEGAGSADTS